MNFPTGKRLQPFLPDLVTRLEHFDALTLDVTVRSPLLAMSAASIDRFLAAERRRLEIKGRSGTKPGTLLKHQIPVRTWAEWDDATQPGFLEIDLVSHDGGVARGEFAWTLDMVDILTGWTETPQLPCLNAEVKPRFPTLGRGEVFYGHTFPNTVQRVISPHRVIHASRHKNDSSSGITVRRLTMA